MRRTRSGLASRHSLVPMCSVAIGAPAASSAVKSCTNRPMFIVWYAPGAVAANSKTFIRRGQRRHAERDDEHVVHRVGEIDVVAQGGLRARRRGRGRGRRDEQQQCGKEPLHAVTHRSE